MSAGLAEKLLSELLLKLTFPSIESNIQTLVKLDHKRVL